MAELVSNLFGAALKNKKEPRDVQEQRPSEAESTDSNSSDSSGNSSNEGGGGVQARNFDFLMRPNLGEESQT